MLSSMPSNLADHQDHAHHLLVHVVAGVVLMRDGKILLVQEKKSRSYGKWNLPGGRVDTGESIESAAIREAKEETGFQVTIDRELPVVHLGINRPVMHAFAATIVSGDLTVPKDEILSAAWFSPAEIKQLELRDSTYILGALEALKL